MYKCRIVITGENQTPNLLLIWNNKLYLLELIAVYETKFDLNNKRKEQSYRALMGKLSQWYNSAQLIDLSMEALSVYGKHLLVW